MSAARDPTSVKPLAAGAAARGFLRQILRFAEVTFRHVLARVRAHGDAIILVHGESRERLGSGVRYADVVRDWGRKPWVLQGSVSFSTAYRALLPNFPILFAAPQYIAGATPLGLLMPAARAFQRVTCALSWPVDDLGEVAHCRTPPSPY